MLRFFRFSPIITVLLLAFLTTQVRAADHVIAIPQSVMRDQARMIHTAVTDIVMGADPGDIIRVIDATAGETSPSSPSQKTAAPMSPTCAAGHSPTR